MVRIRSSEPSGFAAPRYLAVYGFRSHDLKATMAEIGRRLQSGVVKPFPDGVAGAGMITYFARRAPAGASK